MPGERIEYDIERQRHEGFVGRAALLARLDHLLVAGRTDRWVVVTGGPGMGKSAMLAAWLARREAAGAVVPHHFIRRGEYDWDDPAKLVSSLVAQIEERFPDQRESTEDARAHPAARLAAMLMRVSANELMPRHDRLVVLIDGLDEFDLPAKSPGGDPLRAFLPHALPRGISFLCASRPRHPYLSMLKGRDGTHVWIDLDNPAYAADNTATVHAFWELAAPSLGLSARFIDEAVACAAGNLQHAATLRKHLEGLREEQRRVERIPEGLEALLVKLWERVAADPIAVCGLGILCAAREALTLDEVGMVAGWTSVAQRQAFVHGAREFLVETRRADHQPEYRLHHDSIRTHIASMIGALELRGHHAALARHLASWPGSVNPITRRYALRHALTHRVEAGDWSEAWRIAADTSFLEAKCREQSVHEAEADVARASERCQASGDQLLSQRFRDIGWALMRESHWLRNAPEAAHALVWNRLRKSGWSANKLDEQLRIPTGAVFLRIQHLTTYESHALERNLVGHAGWVSACVVTPDGRRAVSSSADWTLKLWDLKTGFCLATFEGHADGVTACAVTPDGRRVVSASRDRTLKLWDLDSNNHLVTFEGHADWATACAVTPDGRRVVSASLDRTLKLWDLDSGRLLATFEGHAGGVTACAVTPDGQCMVSASRDRTLRLWDLKTGRHLATFEGHAGGVTACAVTPDGRRMVSASRDRTLKLWDLNTGHHLATFKGHAGIVTGCAMLPDGEHMISGSEDQTLKLWNVDCAHRISTFEGHTGWVNACAVLPDGERMVSASNDRTLKLWDLDYGGPTFPLEGHTGAVSAFVVTPEGRFAIAISDDGTLGLWGLDDGCFLETLGDHRTFGRGHVKVIACAVTPDGRRVVSASDDHTLKLWDLFGGSSNLPTTFEGHTKTVNACAMHPDGQRMVSASNDRTLKLWDLDNGRLLATFEGHTGIVTACAITPDGRRMVSASWDRTLRLWDLASGHLLATFEGHSGPVDACAVTPDGRLVISASLDRTLKLWNLDSGHSLATLEGHTDGVSACTVTPDGRYTVSASEDQTLKVWDLDTGACLLTHRGEAAFTAVAATATAVVAGDATGTVWFLGWPLAWLRRSTDVIRTHRDVALSPLRPGSALNASSATPPVIALGTVPTRHVILFLAANPSGTTRLALDEECAAIERELRMTSGRDDFDFRSKWAVSIDDMMRHLNELQPTVIHFSGHGGGSADVYVQDPQRQPPPTHRDIGVIAAASIQLQDEQRQPQHVSARALSQMIGTAAPSARLVVLNACFSDAMADELREVVDCVVGMTGMIGDDAARSFAAGFYRALGYRRSVGNAVAQAVATLAAKQFPDEHLPVCRTRDGISADHVRLPSLDPRTSI